MTEDNNPERLWRADDVAEFLGMHVQTVYAKAREGEIPSVKIGSARRFVPAQIRALVTPAEAAS